MRDTFYFDHPNVSNSELKSLSRLCNGDETRLEDKYPEALIMGSIVDSHLTERGANVEGSTKELEELAIALVKYMRADPLIKLFLVHMVGQFRFFKLLTFEWEGVIYRIRARCKFDGFARKWMTAVEYKTTACTTYKAFLASIEFLDYDQAAAWYMDIAKIDRLWIIAISKKTKQIFKFAILRDDDTYKRGRAKYCVRAISWLQLIDGFFYKPITIIEHETDQIPGGYKLFSGVDSLSEW